VPMICRGAVSCPSRVVACHTTDMDCRVPGGRPPPPRLLWSFWRKVDRGTYPSVWKLAAWRNTLAHTIILRDHVQSQKAGALVSAEREGMSLTLPCRSPTHLARHVSSAFVRLTEERGSRPVPVPTSRILFGCVTGVRCNCWFSLAQESASHPAQDGPRRSLREP